MQLNEGQCQYHLGVERVVQVQLILNGALNNDRAYGELYALAKLDVSNMIARFTPGSETYNPQSGLPIYWSYDSGVLMVWPVPNEGYQARIVVQPKNSWIREKIAQWLPAFWKGLEEW